MVAGGFGGGGGLGSQRAAHLLYAARPLNAPFSERNAPGRGGGVVLGAAAQRHVEQNPPNVHNHLEQGGVQAGALIPSLAVVIACRRRRLRRGQRRRVDGRIEPVHGRTELGQCLRRGEEIRSGLLHDEQRRALLAHGRSVVQHATRDVKELLRFGARAPANVDTLQHHALEPLALRRLHRDNFLHLRGGRRHLLFSRCELLCRHGWIDHLLFLTVSAILRGGLAHFGATVGALFEVRPTLGRRLLRLFRLTNPPLRCLERLARRCQGVVGLATPQVCGVTEGARMLESCGHALGRAVRIATVVLGAREREQHSDAPRLVVVWDDRVGVGGGQWWSVVVGGGRWWSVILRGRGVQPTVHRLQCVRDLGHKWRHQPAGALPQHRARDRPKVDGCVEDQEGIPTVRSGGRWSAVGGRRSAVGGRRSVVGGRWSVDGPR